MTPAEVRRLEQAIQQMGKDLRTEMAQLSHDVKKATDFRIGFQAISKGLTYILGALAAAAVIYGAFR